jgi:O-succinylbenzoic acid--CoA ligase
MIQLPPNFHLDWASMASHAEATNAIAGQPWWEDFKAAMAQWLAPGDAFEMRTSGSTGAPKVISLSKAAARASARMTLQHLQLPPGPLLAPLSMTTMGGWMMAVRAIEDQRPLWVTEPTRQPLEHLPGSVAMASLVPYQLVNSLSELHRCHTVLVGGAPLLTGPTWPQGLATRVLLTYGMTETYSHVAFKQVYPVQESHFTALPGVSFEDDQGALVIVAPHLNVSRLTTHDAVERLDSHRFHWLGRTDFVINSGGIKVHPEQVEAKLSAVISVPFYIIGVADAQFGERPALVLAGKPELPLEDMVSLLKPWERPVQAFFVEQLPLSEGGKLKRVQPSLLDHLLGKEDLAIGR